MVDLQHLDIIVCGHLMARSDILFEQSTIQLGSHGKANVCESGMEFEPGAVLPSDEWQTPGRNRTASLTTPCFCGPGVRAKPFVALYRFAEEVQALWDLEILATETLDAVTRNPLIKHWYECVLKDALLERWKNLEGLSYCGATSCRPGMPTTTFNPKTNQYLGLHLDTWEFESIESRRGAKYRLSINIGKEDRFFVFSDTPADVYFDTHVHPRSFTDVFRRQFAIEPIRFFRIRVPPGYAYIAPTDLLFHDGSSDVSRSTTAQFAVRAFFQQDRFFEQ